jgi:hypothetical protein
MMEMLLALSPVIGLALNVATQVVTFRCRPAFGLLRSEYLGFTVGTVAVILMNGAYLYLAPQQVMVDGCGLGLLTVSTYAALGYCYFHFVNLGETARRIRLLRELHDAGGSLTHEELLIRYSAKEIVDTRLRRLLSTGQIVCREQRYFIGSPIMMVIARAMVALKILLLGKASEYDD